MLLDEIRQLLARRGKPVDESYAPRLPVIGGDIPPVAEEAVNLDAPPAIYPNKVAADLPPPPDALPAIGGVPSVAPQTELPAIGTAPVTPPAPAATSLPAIGPDAIRAEAQRLATLTDPNNKVVNKGSGPGGTGKANLKGRAKDAIFAGIIAAGRAAQANGGILSPGQALASFGAGTVGGALRPQWNEEQQRERDIAASQGRLKTLQDTNYRQAQTQNIYDDNALNQEKLDVAKQQKADALALQKENLALQKRKAWHQAHKYFDPAKATDAEKNELASFGETPESIGKYDFTKPTFKVVAGQTFKLDPVTKTFEDAGLPKDGSKEVVEYTVQDPATGLTSKYATTSEKAAQLKTNLIAAGMNIAAANARTQAVIAATGERQDKELTYKRERDAAITAARNTALDLQRQALELRKQGNPTGAAALEQKQLEFKTRMLQRVKEGKLTQADFDEIFTEYADPGVPLHATGTVEK